MNAKRLVAAAALGFILAPQLLVAAENPTKPSVLQKDGAAYLNTDELREGLLEFTDDGSAPAESTAALIGDAMRGQDLFRRCRACHSAKPNGGHRIGPNLYGVVGRRIASVPDFRYSSALSAVRRTWDEATLDQWLMSPGRFARGTQMSFPGFKDARDRADVIAYLKSLPK